MANGSASPYHYSFQQRGPSLVTYPLHHNLAAPVGAIVGGVLGGTAFLAAAGILACLFFTGRLKCSKCCNSSDPPAASAPAGHGSAQATTKAYPIPVASATAAAPASDLPPPPAYGSSDHGATATGTSAPPDAHSVHQYPQMK